MSPFDPEQTCPYASLRVLAYRNHIHGGYVLDVATLTAAKKHDRPGQLLELPKFGGKSSTVSNIDQRLRNPERMLVPSPPRHRQPSVTVSVALPPDPEGANMPSLQPKLEQDNTRYTMPQLIQLRRQMLRFARSLPPGPERNGRRQIAASLRSLVRNTKWLAATIEAPVKEYRVYTVDTEGHFIKTIKLDCPDDASATESARQFIDGLDIELWQLDRKVATFEHKPK
jgi:hypothetical protein